MLRLYHVAEAVVSSINTQVLKLTYIAVTLGPCNKRHRKSDERRERSGERSSRLRRHGHNQHSRVAHVR
jgi:hypothetical protein